MKWKKFAKFPKIQEPFLALLNPIPAAASDKGKSPVSPLIRCYGSPLQVTLVSTSHFVFVGLANSL